MNSARIIRGACVLIGILVGASAAFPDVSEQFHRTVPLAAFATVTVENVNGPITIAAWDSAYADIQAEKKTSKDRRELAKVRIEVSTENGLLIKSTAEREKSFLRDSYPRVNVTYTIKVPRSATVERVRTVNGDIVLRATSGETTVYTTNGSIRAEGVRLLKEVKTTLGSIETSGGTTVRKADTVNGNITIALSPGNDPMDFSVVNGSVKLSLPSGANADVDMRTVNGKVTVPEGFTLKQGEVSKRRISGKLGAGGAAITAKTVNGSITLDVK
jgi:DUF4097 and DUF4098 domain-containing protein YvlB